MLVLVEGLVSVDFFLNSAESHFPTTLSVLTKAGQKISRKFSEIFRWIFHQISSSKIDNSPPPRLGRFHRKIFSSPGNAFIGKIFGKNIFQILHTLYRWTEIFSSTTRFWFRWWPRKHCKQQSSLFQHFQLWRPINFNQSALLLVVEIPNTKYRLLQLLKRRRSLELAIINLVVGKKEGLQQKFEKVKSPGYLQY